MKANWIWYFYPFPLHKKGIKYASSLLKPFRKPHHKSQIKFSTKFISWFFKLDNALCSFVRFMWPCWKLLHQWISPNFTQFHSTVEQSKRSVLLFYNYFCRILQSILNLKKWCIYNFPELFKFLVFSKNKKVATKMIKKRNKYHFWI